MFAQVQALGVSLGQADERINLANLQLAQVQSELAVNREQLRVAKSNLKQEQQILAKELVSLYTTPPPSTLEVILGTTNLNGLLTRLDDTKSVSGLGTEVVGEITAFRSAVELHGRNLAREQLQAARLLTERRDERAAIATQVGERQRLLESIKGEIAQLEAQQRAHELQMEQAAQEAIAAARVEQARREATAVIGASASLPPGAAAPATNGLNAATPENTTFVPASSYGAQVVAIAMSFLGTPYVWGGAAPGGFDCSGLVMYSFAQLGVSLPHSSYAMWNYGVPVSEDELEPGDLVFFDGLGHVGLYVGDGDYIDAPYTGVDVRIDSLSDSWSAANYVGARRIL